MVKIVRDTSSLYSTSDNNDDFHVLPLQVYVGGKTFTEKVDITSAKLVEYIHDGNIPSSSQPAVGRMLDLNEQWEGEDVLGIFMSDGLSGTFATAKANLSEKFTVYNSKTLCGPHRHMVDKALELARAGMDIDGIVEKLDEMIATSQSYLITPDFSYLRRGGRLSPSAATIVGLLKVVPAVKLSADGKKLDKFAIARSFNIAVNRILEEMKKAGVDENYIVSISHGMVEDKAKEVKEKIKKINDKIQVEIYELTPVFITQGGPGCLAIQWIKK